MERNLVPHSCIICPGKKCNNSINGAFDICDYGITYYNEGGVILKKSPFVPLTEISKNLRHEISPILQLIIEQLEKLDNTISMKRVEVDKPIGKILAATIIIDQFIQMITGVNEFHTIPESIGKIEKERSLLEIINNSFHIHSIIKEAHRTKNITINIDVVNNLKINKGVEFIEFLINIIVDNVFKYSLDNTTVFVEVKNNNQNSFDLVFNNKSNTLPDDFEIFKLGIKADKNSRGFGFGLYWAKILEYSYNNLFKDEDDMDKLEIIHFQDERDKTYDYDHSSQFFIIKNINK